MYDMCDIASMDGNLTHTTDMGDGSCNYMSRNPCTILLSRERVILSIHVSQCMSPIPLKIPSIFSLPPNPDSTS